MESYFFPDRKEIKKNMPVNFPDFCINFRGKRRKKKPRVENINMLSLSDNDLNFKINKLKREDLLC